MYSINYQLSRSFRNGKHEFKILCPGQDRSGDWRWIRYDLKPLLVGVCLCHLSDNLGAGIGLDYCLLAREKGARKVIIADLRLTEAAQRAVQSDPNLVFQMCNVTKWKDLQDIIEVSVHRFGDVPDVYVASAGVFEPVRTPQEEEVCQS